jgi:hypothetical protein
MMPKKNLIYFAFGFLLLAQVADAQKSATKMPRKDKVEIGIFLGASNYEGTLEEKPINYNYTLPGYGAMVRYNFTNKFSLRFGMDYGTIEDADSVATSSWRNERNLSFKTTILDGYLAGEYYFATWSNHRKVFSQLYVLGGLGSFYFKPQALYNGTWYNLQPLHTEGQGTQEYPNREPYQLNQVYIPFGLGVRWTLSRTWFLNFEFRANKTFTDYLDDVSLTYASPDVLEQYGGPIAVALANRTAERYPKYADKNFTGTQRGGTRTTDDWFFFTGFTLCHSLKPKRHCYSF